MNLDEGLLRGAEVLVVDDEPANVALVESILGRNGFSRVRSTTDPRRFKDLYFENPPDIVLLDLHMPHLNGLDILHLIGELRGEEEYLPVLILSADATSKARIGALSAGATDFLTKPLDTTEVGLRVLNYLETRRLHLRLEEQRRNLHESMANASVDSLTDIATPAGAGIAVAHLLPLPGMDGGANGVGSADPADTASSVTSHLEGADRSHQEPRVLPNWSVAAAARRLLLSAGGTDADARVLEKAVALHSLTRWDILGFASAEVAVDHQALAVAKSIADNHFERWDGTGDPASLQGKEIPVEARTVAICDMFMALLADVPGKPSVPIGKSIDILETAKGKVLDPDLVDLFLDEVLPFMLRSSGGIAEPGAGRQKTEIREDCGLAG